MSGETASRLKERINAAYNDFKAALAQTGFKECHRCHNLLPPEKFVGDLLGSYGFILAHTLNHLAGIMRKSEETLDGSPPMQAADSILLKLQELYTKLKDGNNETLRNEITKQRDSLEDDHRYRQDQLCQRDEGYRTAWKGMRVIASFINEVLTMAEEHGERDAENWFTGLLNKLPGEQGMHVFSVIRVWLGPGSYWKLQFVPLPGEQLSEVFVQGDLLHRRAHIQTGDFEEVLGL